jgi:hypothetical protein
VYLNGKMIDSVWFQEQLDDAYVLLSLINHDGYDLRITVRKGI